MKVLDPFAGYRLASGHPIFHFSLFAGSFVPPAYYNLSPELLPDYEMTCFMVLRWAHFALFSIAILTHVFNIDSKI